MSDDREQVVMSLEAAREKFTAEIEAAREEYEAGDRSILLECLNTCLVLKMLPPEWLRSALMRAYNKKRNYEIKSWDEVFGAPVKKGERLETRRRNMKIADDLWERVCARPAAGEPIDKKLFDAVGREFGVGGTVAANLYYGMNHLMRGD